MTRKISKVFSIALVAASVLLSACGGGNGRGANAVSGGVSAIATTRPDDLALYMDLAALREDKVLSAVMTKAEASADANVAELLRRIDQVDAAATIADNAPAGVVVIWGRLAKDPKSVPLFGSGAAGTYAAKPALASGVVEYESASAGRSESLFVLDEAVWIVATGAFRDQVRERYASSVEVPARPRSRSVIHASAGARFLKGAGAGKQLASFDHLELDVKPGAASVQGELAFDDEAGAKDAEAKVTGVVALLQMLARGRTGKCTAADHLRLHVERKARTVNVAIDGIDKVAAAWDPALCASASAKEEVAAEPPPPAEPAPEPPPAKPTKKPRPQRQPPPKRAPARKKK